MTFAPVSCSLSVEAQRFCDRHLYLEPVTGYRSEYAGSVVKNRTMDVEFLIAAGEGEFAVDLIEERPMRM